jgi:hypothetical protein
LSGGGEVSQPQNEVLRVWLFLLHCSTVTFPLVPATASVYAHRYRIGLM